MPCEPPYLALDPGTTGALALLHGQSVTVFDVPSVAEHTERGRRTRLDLDGIGSLCGTLATQRPVLVTETVAGRRGDNPFSIGELTRSAGAVEAALAAHGCPVAYRVPPATWKRGLGLLRIPKAERKKASLELARLLFPDCDGFKRVADHNRAEAALIAWWLRECVRSGTAGPFSNVQATNVAARTPVPKRRKKKTESTKNVFC